MPPSKLRSIISWRPRASEKQVPFSVEAYAELQPPIKMQDSFRAEVLKVTKVEPNTLIVFFEVFGSTSERNLRRYKEYFINLAHDYLHYYAKLLGISKIGVHKWLPKPKSDVVNLVKIKVLGAHNLNMKRDIFSLVLYFS